MGDDDDCDAQLTVDFLNELQNGVGRVRVQGARRLVAEQHLRVRCQRTGNRNALLLAARQLRRVGVGLIGQTDQLQQLTGAGLGLVSGDLRQLHREHDIAQHGTKIEEGAALEKHAYFLVEEFLFLFGEFRKLLIVIPYLSRVGFKQAYQHIEQYGLAGTAGADKHIALPFPE